MKNCKVSRLFRKDRVVAPVASQQPLACADPPGLAALAPLAAAAPEQPGSQAGWVAVRRRRRPKQMPVVHHRPLHVANRFSPLGDTQTEKPTGYLATLFCGM